MFQINYEPEENHAENYVVKGINKKDNYYVDENFIYDMEFNSPLNISSEKLNDVKFKSDKKFP